ncbi:MAG: alpha/beta hydrolase [Thermoplasmata archaeon]|nr:alpha/beta hydrolase [Thermoplasmata archaeon]MCI4359986.1 alpha/beta hydrolase [Thermoplasmata archaeon]
MSERSQTAVALHHTDQGQGPALLLLHGLGGDHRVWEPLLPGLTGEFRVLAPDLRGHGETPAPVGSKLTFTEHVADVSLLLETARVDRVHLVGLSAGGLLAIQFTLDRPERVASLVSIAGAVNVDNHTRAIADRWVETYQKDGFDAYVLRLAKDLYYPDWVEAHLDIVDRLRADAAGAEYASLLRWRGAIREFDVRGRVGKIRVPTLIVHAMEDQVIDVAHARLLRQSIPGAELRLFAQTGHLLPTERPEEVGAAIRDWVRKVEARNPDRPSRSLP